MVITTCTAAKQLYIKNVSTSQPRRWIVIQIFQMKLAWEVPGPKLQDNSSQHLLTPYSTPGLFWGLSFFYNSPVVQ